jgi:hypothetical protein
MRIFEGIGTVAGANSGSLVLEHADPSGVSSILFKSKNAGVTAGDYAYIQYEENGGTGLSANGSEKGVLTIGIENDATTTTNNDSISLYAANGLGFVGVNTKTPERNLDVSGGMAVSGDVSLNGNAFMNRLNYTPAFVSGTSFNATFPMNSIYIVTATTNGVIFNLLDPPAGVTSGIITIRKIGSVDGGSTITLTHTGSIIFASGAIAAYTTAPVCAGGTTSVQFFFSNGNYYVM